MLGYFKMMIEMKSDKSSQIEKVEAVTERGSLGLLALGAVGLMAWRDKKEQIRKAKQEAHHKTN
jgi:hypothetical protein